MRKVLNVYKIIDSKAVQTPLASHMRLYSSQCPTIYKKKCEMV